MNQKTTSWGSVANWYDDMLKTNDNSFQTHVIEPNLIRLADLKPGETILDLACGSGFFSEKFAKIGARVIGIDIAPELIAKAKEKNISRAEFFVSDAESFPTVATGSVTAIICVLALQNIRNVSAVFKECSRVLKQTGKILVVINHPSFRIPQASSWGWDEKTHTEYRRLDSYLSETQVTIDMNPGSTVNKETTLSFHRPLSFYSKTAANAGFCISRMEEWISHREPPKGKVFVARDKARKEFPLFLFLELRKFS